MLNYDPFLCCREAQRYILFSDDEIREEIAATENILLRVKTKLMKLAREYRDRLDKQGKVLAYCELDNMLSTDRLVTTRLRRKLDVLIVKRELKRASVEQIVLVASKGRVQSLSGLTEIEAMIVWHLLEGADALQ